MPRAQLLIAVDVEPQHTVSRLITEDQPLCIVVVTLNPRLQALLGPALVCKTPSQVSLIQPSLAVPHSDKQLTSGCPD